MLLFTSLFLQVFIRLELTLSSFLPKANCIDSTAAPEAVFASEVKKMSAENMKPQEQLTLEPYERDHAVVVGIYRWILMHKLFRNFHTNRKHVLHNNVIAGVCSFVFMPGFQLGCLTCWSGLFYNGVVLKVSFFLQTATQAEEVRFITIHVLLSPESTASATRWTHSLQMTKDWYKRTIYLSTRLGRFPFIPDWHRQHLYWE